MPGRRRERFVPIYMCPHEGCERGEKDFHKKNNLYQHYLIHIGCKAMCNACDIPFTSLAALIRHARSCGDDFFNSSPHDAKIMVDLIVSSRRKLEEHVSERIKERRSKFTSNRGIKKKSLPLSPDHSGGQTPHVLDALLSPEASPRRMSNIETNVSEGSQQSYEDQNESPSTESMKTSIHQPHRWIPDLRVSELDGTGRSAQKFHQLEDFTCPHGECSSKKDWGTRDKLLKHYYSHFACAAICNTCNRGICSLDSLVVHTDWCKGFLSSSPRAATVRAELMKSCEKLLDERLAKRFTAGLMVEEYGARNENSNAKWKYLISCTMNPKLPFPDHKISGLQVLPDTNVYSPSKDLPASILGAKPRDQANQQSYNGDLELLPKRDANSALRPDYDELPELQQSPSRHYFDAQTTVPTVQQVDQQTCSLETQQWTRDVSLVAPNVNGPSLSIYQATPVDVSGSIRASFHPIVSMDPSFYSQWSTELCEPLSADMSALSQARVDPATNIDPNIWTQLPNNICEAVPANGPGMNQLQLDPQAHSVLSSPLPSLTPLDQNMCLSPTLDVNATLMANQIDFNCALCNWSILMDATPCSPLITHIGCNECSLKTLQARPSAPTAQMLHFPGVHNHAYLGGGENGMFNENSYLGWN